MTPEIDSASAAPSRAALAGELDTTASARTFVTFDLAGQTLGADVHFVREILDRTRITQLPNASHDVEGIIDIRGESIPIINMGAQLGMPRYEDGEETRIIVFEVDCDGVSRPVGVLADRVRDVTQIDPADIAPPPTVVGAHWRGEMLFGLARRDGVLILLLDLDTILVGPASNAALDSLVM